MLTCLEAGAAAAGCTMDYEWQEPVYADLVDNDPFMALYAANAERVGRTLADPKRRRRDRRQHGHGQRELPRAVDPPDDPGVAAQRRHPLRPTSSATPAVRRATRR